MSRFLTDSSRRFLAVAALVTATAVPSVVLTTQGGAGAATAATKVTTYSVNWH